MDSLNNVDWEHGGNVHNWRRHVPVNVRKIWDSFFEFQKKALYEWAESLADGEEWE
jgi:hypothetical protein